MPEFAEVITDWRPAAEGGFWLAESDARGAGGKKMTKEVFLGEKLEGRILSEGVSR
jgi:hypothetical protein